MSKITTVTRDIAAGETLCHDSALIIKGNVGDGAVLDIKGGLEVHGDIGHNVKIAVDDKAGDPRDWLRTHTLSNSFNISARETIYGIYVTGTIGDNVALSSTSKIIVTAAGDNLQATSANHFKAATLGHGARVKAGADATLLSAGDNATLDAGHTLRIKCAGVHAKLSAGYAAYIEVLGASAGVKAQYIYGSHPAHKSAYPHDHESHVNGRPQYFGTGPAVKATRVIKRW